MYPRLGYNINVRRPVLDLTGSCPAMWNKVSDDGTDDIFRHRDASPGIGTAVQSFANDKWTLSLSNSGVSSNAMFSAVCIPRYAASIAAEVAISTTAPGRDATNQRASVAITYVVRTAQGATDLRQTYFLTCGEGHAGAYQIDPALTATEKTVIGSSMTASVPVPYYVSAILVSVAFSADWDSASSWRHAVSVTLTRDRFVSVLR